MRTNCVWRVCLTLGRQGEATLCAGAWQGAISMSRGRPGCNSQCGVASRGRCVKGDRVVVLHVWVLCLVVLLRVRSDGVAMVVTCTCVTGALEGQYRYMPDLKELESRRPSVMPVGWRREWSRVCTPLRCEAWEYRLLGHPDMSYCEYLIGGKISGFRVGYAYSKAGCVSATQNGLSGGAPRCCECLLGEGVGGRARSGLGTGGVVAFCAG